MVKMKSNKIPAFRVSVVLIIMFIGVFLLTSCVTTTSGVYVNKGSESDDISSATIGSESSATLPSTSAKQTAASATQSKTQTTTETSSDTETLTHTSKKTTTQKKTSAAASSSSSHSETPSDTSSSRVALTDKVSSMLSRLNSDEIFSTANAVDVTVHSDETTKSNPEKLDFTDCAFLGNSRVLSVENYGFCKNVYGKVGLNVDTVFTEKCEGSKVPVIDELKGKSFKKIFIMFGDNECGWGSMDVFVKHYKKVIDAVHERVPGAEVYILSVLPISEAASAKNEYGYNQQAINNVNKLLRKLADDEGLTYVDAASAITNSKGYLPDEASTDGSHLGKEYTRKWLTYVAKYV